MLEACKILKVNLKELESKTYEDFLQKHHNFIYQQGGDKKVQSTDVEALARIEFLHHEKKRQSKINLIKEYIEAMETKRSDMMKNDPSNML